MKNTNFYALSQEKVVLQFEGHCERSEAIS